MSSLIDSLRTVVRREMSRIEGSAHGIGHVERVTRIASFLAGEESADLELVQVASLLHDIGRVHGEPHHEKGVEPSEEILLEAGYPRESLDRVLWIVGHHHASGRDELRTVEGWVVWDADKLDLIGLSGVSRAFHYAGETGVPYGEALRWCKNRSMVDPYRFITETGRRLAERRYEAMRWFSQKLEEELSLSDIT